MVVVGVGGVGHGRMRVDEALQFIHAQHALGDIGCVHPIAFGGSVEMLHGIAILAARQRQRAGAAKRAKDQPTNSSAGCSSSCRTRWM